MTDHKGVLEALEGNAPVLFLVGGGMMFLFAVNTYFTTFVGTSYPVVESVIGPSGFLVSVLGLLGLYPALATRTPRLARVAAGIALLATAGWVAIIGTGIGETLGVLSGLTGPLAIIPLVVVVSMTLGFGLFGATILYTGSHSWIIGALLLLESINLLVLILGLAPYILLTTVGHTLVFLGIGVTLRATGVTADSTDPAPDSAV
jgi:hypothetical protein